MIRGESLCGHFWAAGRQGSVGNGATNREVGSLSKRRHSSAVDTPGLMHRRQLGKWTQSWLGLELKGQRITNCSFGKGPASSIDNVGVTGHVLLPGAPQ